jgi:hypothetical protein
LSPTGQISPGANHRCTVWDIRLAQVVQRHLPPARGEQGADPLGDLGPAHQRHAHDLGDCFARDVVLGRSESAAQDHRIAALECLADAGDDAPEVVADFGLEMRIDAGQGQLAADPGGVGIDDLAEQQLGADGDDFAAHVHSLNQQRARRARQRFAHTSGPDPTEATGCTRASEMLAGVRLLAKEEASCERGRPNALDQSPDL